VEYEGWFTDPAANIEKLRKFLDLPWLQSESDLSLVLSGIIDRAARHDDSNHREASQPLVRTLYKLASSDGQDGARDQIAYIVSQFVSFQQLQKPLLQAFEDVARTAAKYPETEQEVTRLRAVVSERDAVVEAAGVRAAAVEGRLAEALAETEAQRAQIADLARERDELGIALQAAQAELATHEAALRRAEQETQEHGTAALAMQSEIAASRIALAQAERAEQERTASVAALEAELSALREMLAHTEQEVQRRAASEAALQSEIARLHGTLAKAEHETQGRAATVATLQAEICALQETLTAARQVGKAAIAAFRIETATPIAAVAERGLSLAIMRFFGSRASV
jgi:DNA repair exonuclease SbcCD ATPase subunit